MSARIQITRNKPWRADNPDAVIVDRTTKWGNPFKIGDLMPGLSDQPMDASRCFENFTTSKLPVHEFKGMDLAWWCSLPTHGPGQTASPCIADDLQKYASLCAGPKPGKEG